MESKPSELLLAANASIDFVDRPRTQAELRAWRDQTTEGMAVRLVHGPGGQGKTRLAGHLAGQWQHEGWAVLAAHHRDDRSAPDAFEVPDFEDAAGIAVVVDYAERWDTTDLLTLLGDTCLPGRLPVRVLLLARPVGTWWQGLDYRIQHDLRVTPTAYELPPLEQEAASSRRELFTAARERFADLLGSSEGREAPVPPALDRHEGYELVLSVHMAALAAVLARQEGVTAPADPVEASIYLLNRERNLWTAMSRAAHEAPVNTSPDVMGQLVYTATVTGRLGYDDALAAVEAAGVESREHPGKLLKDHALCYPPSGPARGHETTSSDQRTVTCLEPLYPDLLGEDFIALLTPGHSCGFAADPWAGKAPARLLTPPGGTGDRSGQDNGAAVWTRHGVSTMIEAARRWPHLAEKLSSLLAAAPHLALHAGGTALSHLVELPGIEVVTLEGVYAILPAGSHPDFDVAAAILCMAISEHRLSRIHDPAERAQWFTVLAGRLGCAGRWTEAVVAAEQAQAIYRQLAAADPVAHGVALSESLGLLAISLVGSGRGDHALALAEESVDLVRSLVGTGERRSGSALVKALYGFGQVLEVLDRPEQALAAVEEAMALHGRLAAAGSGATEEIFYNPWDREHLISRVLARAGRSSDALVPALMSLFTLKVRAQRDPAAHRPDLADQLTHCARLLANAGRHADAVSYANEAVEIRREMDSDHPTHLVRLTDSLLTVGKLLLETAQREPALASAAEALSVTRGLDAAAADDDDVLPQLAGLYANTAALMVGLGRPRDALEPAELAVTAYRRLAATSPAAYRNNLATALENLGNVRDALGLADGASYLSEALRLWREHTGATGEVRAADTAMSLNNQAAALLQSHRYAEGLAAAEEAVGLLRPLAEGRSRPEHLPRLAMALNNNAMLLRGMGRLDEALRLSAEAVDYGGELLRADRHDCAHEAGGAVSNYALLLAETGDHARAVKVSDLAVQIHRQLVAVDESALPGLGDSLANHGRWLAGLGEHEQAVAAIEEAVTVYLRAETAQPGACALGLAEAFDSLRSLSSRAGRYREALHAAAETDDRYAALAAAHERLFEPELAASRYHLAETLLTLNRHAEALTPARDAARRFADLAKADPRRYARSAAVAHHRLSAVLSALDRPDEALTAATTAVENMHSHLLTHRDADQVEMAPLLENVVQLSGELEKYRMVLLYADQAIELRRQRAATDPDEHLLPLAMLQWSYATACLYLDDHCDRAVCELSEAVKVFEELARLRPDPFADMASSAYETFADLIDRLGHPEEATVLRRRLRKR
ncbi:tetratricopeptide repeat protein [Planomonospora algeriensis]